LLLEDLHWTELPQEVEPQLALRQTDTAHDQSNQVLPLPGLQARPHGAEPPEDLEDHFLVHCFLLHLLFGPVQFLECRLEPLPPAAEFRETLPDEDVRLSTLETSEPPPPPPPPDLEKTPTDKPIEPVDSEPVLPEHLSGFSWSGEVPAAKWMNFYTKVLAKFVTGGNLRIDVTFEVGAPDGMLQAALDEMQVALRELKLNELVSPRTGKA
jgi:hypothetical protein